MSNTVKPRNEAEIVAAVQDARNASTPIEIVGGGTKHGLGRPTQTAVTLDMSGLSGITLYEPSELVIGAHAGTAMSQIRAKLAENRQQLAFEVPDFSELFGNTGAPTIGAVAATNLSGPRRIYAGAARDALLGVRMVTGHGEAVKNGGRVMKNVTGYDLVKLSAGAYGTLGVLTEVTFKVLPIPETEATLVFEGLGDGDAVACLASGLGSPFEVSGAAHLPATEGSLARTCLRIEGFADQVDYRFNALAKVLKRHGTAMRIDAAGSSELWQMVRDCAFFADRGDHAIWRISVQPSNGPRIGHVIRNSLDGEVFYDWGGGLIWAAVPLDHTDGGAQVIRAATAETGGHATLFCAPETLRAAVPVFHPETAAVAKLTTALKQAFDPDRILNPGRMFAGI
jgi:glycolate oxidase FAD binding subunit